MPTFNYGGIDLDLDWLVSYARVSSPQQTLEHGGGGIERQREEFEAFAAAFGVSEYTGLGSLVDDGKSGSTGKNIATGALGLFLDDIKKLPPRTGLVIESFSRLNRLVIDKAMGVFLAIVCDAGVPLITLQDRRAYTVHSFRRDKGVVHQISSAMHLARDHAENVSYYSLKAWRTRRGSCTNITPSWIIVIDGALVADPVKAAIVVRIFHMALTMGVNTIVAILNAEGVPVLNERKRKRGVLLWNTGGITKLLRGRQVLGEQEIARYVEGKRVVTPGAYDEDAYPAIIDRDLWEQVQAKLDSRRTGVSTGRNVQRYTNLFGDLARCRCGERMKIHRRGNRGEYVYLGCSARRDGACNNRTFYRLDRIEAAVLDMIANLTWPTDTPDDPIAPLETQIVKAKSDAAAIETAYQRAMLRAGELAERTQVKLESDHAGKLATVTRLERQLAVLKSAKPADEQLSALQTLSERLARLSGPALVEARGKVAGALPGLFRCLTLAPDMIEVTVRDGRVFRLGDWVGALTPESWLLIDCEKAEKRPVVTALLRKL